MKKIACDRGSFLTRARLGEVGKQLQPAKQEGVSPGLQTDFTIDDRWYCNAPKPVSKRTK